jgi:hypothetical protein
MKRSTRTPAPSASAVRRCAATFVQGFDAADVVGVLVREDYLAQVPAFAG